MLLRNRFGILGMSFGLINADVNEVADHFLEWQCEIGRKHGFGLNQQAIRIDVESSLAMMLPLEAPVCSRYLFLPTKTNWTAYFDNGKLGTDAAGAMPVLAQRMAVRAIRATCIPHTMPARVTQSTRGSYGANILEVYDERGDVRRAIYCANDGGKWKFGQSGPAFEFENTPQYLTRRVSERFTEEMLRAYLNQIAVDGFECDAYSTGTNAGIFIQRESRAK
jgi:hypothetical protein